MGLDKLIGCDTIIRRGLGAVPDYLCFTEAFAMYTLLLALIYLIFISLGLPDSLLGSAWPTMRLAFDMPLDAAGIISMLIAGCTICSSLLSERLTKRFTTRWVTVVSVFLTAAALLGFSAARQFWMLCLWAVPYGLGAGAIDSAINNYVALHYKARHMSWLHCFWGVGTIISPYIMSWAITHAEWQTGYRTVAALQLCIGAVLVLTLPVWKIHQPRGESDEAAPVLGIRGALRIQGAPTLFLGFFAYCAGESIAMLWSSSFLAEARGVSVETAAAFGALFFIGITAGRFAAGFISDRLGDRRMIRLGTAVAALGVAAIALPVRSNLPSLAGLVLFGVGCAPVYPSIIHATPDNFGAKNSQAIIGMQMASAYVGSTFIPPLFGLIADRAGLQWMPLFLALFLALMISMTEATFRRVARVKAE